MVAEPVVKSTPLADNLTVKSKVHPKYKTIWSDRLAIVSSGCVSTRQGGRRHRDRGLTLAVSEPQTKGADHAGDYHLRRN